MANPAVCWMMSCVSSGVWLAIVMALRNWRPAACDEPSTASSAVSDDSRNAAISTTLRAAATPTSANEPTTPASAEAAPTARPPRSPRPVRVPCARSRVFSCARRALAAA